MQKRRDATLVADSRHLRAGVRWPYDRPSGQPRERHSKGFGQLPCASTSSSLQRPLARRAPVLLAALILSAIGGAISGCGSAHSPGTNADPASAIPASAPLYANAIVRPEGSLKSSARAAAETLTHQADPYLHLLQALQTPGSPPLDFSRDVAPWLGPQAGVFLGSLGAAEQASVGQLISVLGQALLGGSSTTSAFPFGARDPATGSGGGQGAFVLDTSNLARARSFVDAQAERAGAHPASYRNVSYRVSSGGVAFGVVDRFVVIGSESGLRGVIDTTLGAPSLRQNPSYGRLLASAPPGTLAHLYANPAAAAASAARSGTSSAGSAASGASGPVGVIAGTRPTNVSFVPDPGSITLDADSLTSPSAAAERARAGGGSLSSLSEGAGALGELPAESWFAVGLGNVGATLGADARGLRGVVSLAGSLAGSPSEGQTAAGFNVRGLLEGLLTPLEVLGANSAAARADFQSWMSSAGIFASGSGLLELRGAVVIASTDPALSRAAVGRLGEQLHKPGATITPVSIPGTEASVAARLPGLPIVLYIAAGPNASGQSRFVIGLGEASVTDALKPSGTLSGSTNLAAASALLGEGIQPSLTVNVTALLGLLEGVGLTANPPISTLVPYLRAVPAVAGGGKSLGGGIDRLRVVAKLQKTS
jgi:hypothetical protein